MSKAGTVVLLLKWKSRSLQMCALSLFVVHGSSGPQASRGCVFLHMYAALPLESSCGQAVHAAELPVRVQRSACQVSCPVHRERMSCAVVGALREPDSLNNIFTHFALLTAELRSSVQRKSCIAK